MKKLFLATISSLCLLLGCAKDPCCQSLDETDNGIVGTIWNSNYYHDVIHIEFLPNNEVQGYCESNGEAESNTQVDIASSTFSIEENGHIVFGDFTIEGTSKDAYDLVEADAKGSFMKVSVNCHWWELGDQIVSIIFKKE